MGLLRRTDGGRRYGGTESRARGGAIGSSQCVDYYLTWGVTLKERSQKDILTDLPSMKHVGTSMVDNQSTPAHGLIFC